MLEELDAIETQMKEQQRITRQLLMVAHVNPKDDPFYNRFNMKVTLPLTYSGKLDYLADLRARAEKLAQYSRDYIEDNKDRQEAAICVFTILTIIFPPISTVSSIFGMKTFDVPNMGQSQWMLWATVVPVTIVVAITSLFGRERYPGEREAVVVNQSHRASVDRTDRRRIYYEDHEDYLEVRRSLDW